MESIFCLLESMNIGDTSKSIQGESGGFRNSVKDWHPNCDRNMVTIFQDTNLSGVKMLTDFQTRTCHQRGFIFLSKSMNGFLIVIWPHLIEREGAVDRQKKEGEYL